MGKIRLIDANALEQRFTAIAVLQKGPKIRLVKAICEIHDAPTVDAVEVVRCKDCTHRVEGTKMCAHPKAMGWDAIEPEDNDFCSYGERRDGE